MASTKGAGGVPPPSTVDRRSTRRACADRQALSVGSAIAGVLLLALAALGLNWRSSRDAGLRRGGIGESRRAGHRTTATHPEPVARRGADALLDLGDSEASARAPRSRRRVRVRSAIDRLQPPAETRAIALGPSLSPSWVEAERCQERSTSALTFCIPKSATHLLLRYRKSVALAHIIGDLATIRELNAGVPLRGLVSCEVPIGVSGGVVGVVLNLDGVVGEYGRHELSASRAFEFGIVPMELARRVQWLEVRISGATTVMHSFIDDELLAELPKSRRVRAETHGRVRIVHAVSELVSDTLVLDVHGCVVLTGRCVGRDGEPLADQTVRVEPSGESARTDVEGSFSLIVAGKRSPMTLLVGDPPHSSRRIDVRLTQGGAVDTLWVGEWHLGERPR